MVVLVGSNSYASGSQWLCWLSVVVLVVSDCAGLVVGDYIGCAGCQWLF